MDRGVRGVSGNERDRVKPKERELGGCFCLTRNAVGGKPRTNRTQAEPEDKGGLHPPGTHILRWATPWHGSRTY